MSSPNYKIQVNSATVYESDSSAGFFDVKYAVEHTLRTLEKEYQEEAFTKTFRDELIGKKVYFVVLP